MKDEPPYTYGFPPSSDDLLNRNSYNDPYVHIRSSARIIVLKSEEEEASQACTIVGEELKISILRLLHSSENPF